MVASTLSARFEFDMKTMVATVAYARVYYVYPLGQKYIGVVCPRFTSA